MMPKLSTQSAEAVDLGIGTEAAAELGGYKASYNVNQDTDLTPLLQGLPHHIRQRAEALQSAARP